MEKLEEAEAFIQSHTQYLSGNDIVKESIRIRSWCRIAFEKGDDRAVLNNVAGITLNDHFYIIDRHILKFKAHFELGEYDEVLEGKRAFFDFLREKYEEEYISMTYKIIFENFFNLLELVINQPFESYSKQSVYDTLDGYEGQVAETKWLKSIIARLR